MAKNVFKILQYIKQFYLEKLSADRVEFLFEKGRNCSLGLGEHTEDIFGWEN
jgi:hypothetical protein